MFPFKVLVLTVCSVSAFGQEQSIIELINADIVTLVKDKLRPDLIIAKIEGSHLDSIDIRSNIHSLGTSHGVELSSLAHNPLAVVTPGAILVKGILNGA